MNDNSGLPAAIGLAAGVAFIVVFSLFSSFPSSSSTGNLPGVSIVVIPEGASLESNPAFFAPEVIKVTIGVNNTVRWISEDTVPHGITSDTGYRDPYSGRPFDSYMRSAEQERSFIMPGETYEFTFTEPGQYPYHGEPHPWMQGTVTVLAP